MSGKVIAAGATAGWLLLGTVVAVIAVWQQLPILGLVIIGAVTLALVVVSIWAAYRTDAEDVASELSRFVLGTSNNSVFKHIDTDADIAFDGDLNDTQISDFNQRRPKSRRHRPRR